MRQGRGEGGMGEKSYHTHSRCPAAWLLLQDPDYPSVGLGAARLLQGQQVRPAMNQGGQCTGSKPGWALCSPGDLLQRRAQASQVESPGTAITADELTSIVTHGTFVLVLLTRQEGPHRPSREHSARLRDLP